MKSLLITLLLLPAFSQAAELHGVKMPDTIEMAGKALVLNGLGTRIADFLPLKVYVAGLYVSEKSTESEKILNSPESKRLDFEFVRSVGRKRIQDAWKDGVKKNCSTACEQLEKQAETLSSYMEDMATGDKMSFVFQPTGVEVSVKGQAKGTVSGSDLSRTLLAVFIGKNPPNKQLRDGLLGLSAK